MDALKSTEGVTFWVARGRIPTISLKAQNLRFVLIVFSDPFLVEGVSWSKAMCNIINCNNVLSNKTIIT